MEKLEIQPATLVYKAWVYPLHLFVAFLGTNQFRLIGLRFVCLFYYGNTQRLAESCFYQEAGNRTCAAWFTRHSAYPLHHGGFFYLHDTFLAFLGLNQFPRVGLKFVLVLSQEHPKAHRKWFYGEAGNRTCAHWFTRHSAYQLHHGSFFYLHDKKLFVAFLGINQFGRVALRIVLVL